MPPERFFDREELLRALLSRLLGGQNLALFGSRYSGKSSLLAMVAHEIEPATSVVLLDPRTFLPRQGQTTTSFTAEFWEYVLRRRSSQPPPLGELSIPDMVDCVKSELESETYATYLLVDDFHSLVENALQTDLAKLFFESIRVILSATYKLRMLITSREQVQVLSAKIEASGSSLINMFIAYDLDANLPTEEELLGLLDEYLKELPAALHFTEDEKKQLVNIANQNFARLQFAAGLVFDEKLKMYEVNDATTITN